MNWPNRLTILRIALTPVFLLFFLLDLPHRFFWAAAVFALASITDFLDGYLARKHKQVTAFGKLTDPVADKLLTTAALLAFLQLGWCDIWLVLLVLAREFLVTSVRMVASAQGVVIPANIWGKVKTASQMVFILLLLLLAEAAQRFDFLSWLREAAHFTLLSEILLWLTTAMTVISGITYVYSASKIIDFKAK
ncbi:MAG: CDP-diacylglycerol--glycerol-3-phosphate 3-phosphatidyltransferase [Oscillospiraceae bacterium]|jgi:CDP-diacylglycerol--glycerol-3-phosphate 3-phosphatidyltransferase|nr:CDP-diacylglycerol--glycerol-3-phosphate 3-phosphatidyltransferase [Oscillospiraceae bacterium]